MTNVVNPQAVRPASGLQAALKAREHEFIVAGIANLSTDDEGDDMNLAELQKKSTEELRNLYNGLVQKNIKRFESRKEAERRTAKALKEADQWTGAIPGKTTAAAPAKTATAAKTAKASKTTRKATKSAVGRPPAANVVYRVANEQPKMNSGSARTKVFLYVKENAGKKGIDTESIENAFVNDETLNVRSVLSYLTKVKILEVVKES